MVSHIIGYFAIFLGVLWVIWPQLLRGWVIGKASWTIFWLLFFVLFYPFMSWASRSNVNGWIAAFVAFFILGRLLRSLISKAAGKIPLLFFRIAGLLNVVSGLSLIFFRK